MLRSSFSVSPATPSALLTTVCGWSWRESMTLITSCACPKRRSSSGWPSGALVQMSLPSGSVMKGLNFIPSNSPNFQNW